MNPAALRLFEQRLRSLTDLQSEAAGALESAMVKAVASNVAAQRNPDGSSFAPTESGKPALVNAASKITSRTSERGDTVTVAFELAGPEAMHQSGSARGYKRLGFTRRVLPTAKELPRSVVRAHAKATEAAFRRRMHGG